MGRMPTIAIVGAARGIGRATALLFAERGYDLLLLSTQEWGNDRLARQLRQFGGRVTAITTDATDVAALRRAFRQGLLELRSIDVLANCTGLYVGGSCDRSDLEDWRRAMETNYWSCANAIHCLLPYFVGRGRGTIVNIGSFGRHVPLPRMVAYCASRYAVMGLTESLRVELAPKGIRVGLVCPGLERPSQSRLPPTDGAEGSCVSSWLGSTAQVAEAIWQIVEGKELEIFLGSEQVGPEAYRLMPMVLQRVAQHPDWFSEES